MSVGQHNHVDPVRIVQHGLHDWAEWPAPYKSIEHFVVISCYREQVILLTVLGYACVDHGIVV